MKSNFFRSATASRGICGPVLLLFLAAGCSSKGTITGKVTYKGKPLPVGTVMFVSEQGEGTVTADIQDGEYKAMKVPTGPAKIAVYTPPSQSPPAQYMAKMIPPKEVLQQLAPDKSSEDIAKSAQKPKSVPIPEKFHDPNTSGLKYTVKRGLQVYDIDLQDK